MKCVAAALLPLVTMASPLVWSAPGQIKGHGAVSCGEYITDRNTNRTNYVYVAWAQGYLSAYNLFANGIKVKSIPDHETIHPYLDKHCRENPLDMVQEGVDQLRADLIQRQSR